jgi:hypothetical protein
MVDVMRGAIAEVEDYARVSVATRSQAALAGSAVADIIHLLAELIENATTLSPPYTSVRVAGDTVANGFAIEVEDRGLGMSPPRLAELNERLASPPEFNPSDSEQLGLFVVGQLAKRHGIRVTLKASPYGGTAAIVLIPRHLVVTEEAFRAGLPGEPTAIGMARLTTNGNHAAPADLADQAGAGFTDFGGGLPGLGQPPGVRISGPLRRSQGITPERPDRGAHAAPASGPANGTAGAGPDDLPRRHHDEPGTPAGAGAMPDSDASSGFDVFTPRRHTQGTGETPVPSDAAPATGPGAFGSGPAAPAGGPGAPYPGNGSYVPSPAYPVSGSSPYPGPGSGPAPGAGGPPFAGTGPAPYPHQPAPFPGWTPNHAPGASGRTAPGPDTPAGPATPMTPVASSRPGQASGPPWELSRETGPLPAVPGGPGPQTAEPGGNGDIKGLPRRIRQASLAPQLRADPPQRRTTMASAGPSSGPTPAEIRQTMSALQRGWQEGRSQRTAGAGPGEPPRAPSAASAGPPAGTGSAASPSPGPDSSSSASGGHDSTADEEARGGSDGT